MGKKSSEQKVNPANRFGWDYAKEASGFSYFPFPIIDVHSHINGGKAVKIYKEAAEMFGIGMTYSMTHLDQIPAVRDVLGKKIRFIAMPKFTDEERYYDDISGYMKEIEKYYLFGSRIIKFWSAPRSIDYGNKIGKVDLLKLNSKRRLEIMRLSEEMGMVFMVHVGDPDTWFATKYKNSRIYGTKIDQYKPFQEILGRYKVPFIAAHMGGWPEDLEFLSNLLNTHSNLYLDTSATKWMVRELSKHSREEFLSFLTEWKGRILFGSDIVSSDDHLQLTNGVVHEESEVRQRTFDLYASRYWALRTLFEKDYQGESPISDPDLSMFDPSKYNEKDAPQLIGKSLPLELLESLYYKAANKLLEHYHK